MKAVGREQKQRNIGHHPPLLNEGWKLRNKMESDRKK
jgi:hypothetical protein